MRIAIIYKSGEEYIAQRLQSISKNDTLTKISQNLPCPITVEESKGLEFDAVIVVKNNMTDNEQYISYTRALDNLYITEVNELT